MTVVNGYISSINFSTFIFPPLSYFCSHTVPFLLTPTEGRTEIELLWSFPHKIPPLAFHHLKHHCSSPTLIYALHRQYSAWPPAPMIATPHSHTDLSDLSVLGLLHFCSETKCKLHEQHLIFHSGNLQSNGMSISPLFLSTKSLGSFHSLLIFSISLTSPPHLPVSRLIIFSHLFPHASTHRPIYLGLFSFVHPSYPLPNLSLISPSTGPTYQHSSHYLTPLSNNVSFIIFIL